MSEPRNPNDPFPPLEPFHPPPENPFPPLDVGSDPPSDWIQSADAHDLPTRENRLAALGRFAFPPPPPLDEEGVAARAQRWAAQVVVFVTALMLVFNIHAVQNWARQQPPGWITATVQQLADVWAARLTLLGADQPREGVRDLYQRARDQRFVGQDKR